MVGFYGNGFAFAQSAEMPIAVIRSGARGLLELADCCRPLRAAQQPDIELATGEQHVVESLANIACLDGGAAIAPYAGLGHATHQLLNEGGARAFGTLYRFVNDDRVERQTLAIELDEFAASVHVGEGDFDRL